MQEEQGRFRARDGTRLYYRFFKNKAARDVMVILHGHGEHSGRYCKFSRILREESISLAVMDLRGNGQSEGRRVFVDDFRQYLDDVNAFLDFLRETGRTQGDVILLGHSLGALIALYRVMESPAGIKAMILSSPCFGLRLPGFLVRMNRFFDRWIPAFTYGNPVYPPHLSHDPEEIIRYRQDPLIERKITVRLLNQMVTYTTHLDEIPEFSFPFSVYLLMAEEEKVVDSRKSKDVYARLKVPDKEIYSFPGFYHEIFNELGQERVFEALKQCLRKIAAGPGKT